MTSKHFSEIRLMDRDSKLGPPDEFSFKMKNVTTAIAVANCLRRIPGLDIGTFSVSPETINYKVNTSVWNPELITHQLSFIPMKPEFLQKTDLNMLELILDVKNNETDSVAYRHVLSGELTMKNKETGKDIPIEDIILYDNMPIVLLGPGQEISLTCNVEYRTKRESDSRHQAATIGIDYVEDENNPDKDPLEILFNVNIQTGIEPKKLISLSFENLIGRLKKLQKAIKEKNADLFYIQLNRYHRYDFVFIGEDHTIGNLIEKWNNRHDLLSVTGYRQTRDKKAITIDYGLNKFSPAILIKDNLDDEEKLENLIEKSVVSLDEKKEKEQRESTVRIFTENLSRLEKYVEELRNDWDKVNLSKISTKEYMNDINKKRLERLER